MNNKHTLAAVLMLALGLAAPAPASAQQGSGLYAGASLGQAQYRKTCDFYSGACDDTDDAYRVFAGYHFSPAIAVEAGYANLGRLSVDGSFGGIATRFDAVAKALDLSVLPAYMVTERIALFGRFGAFRSQLEVSGGGGTVSEHNTSWTYGLGVRLDFGGAVSLRAEWQRYDNLGGSSTGEDDIDFLSAGVLLRF